MIRMTDLIQKKRDGGKLDVSEIKEMIMLYTAGDIPDYQMSAMMMAIFYQGLDDEETLALTLAMRDSGDTLDLSAIKGIKAERLASNHIHTALVVCSERR